jgi:hypothetical protein
LYTDAASYAEPQIITPVRSAFMRRVFYGFGVLAVLSIGINYAGTRYGQTIAMGGHSDDPSTREIVIGNDVLSIPANMIRFEPSRRDGVAARVDLYLRWPQLDGYSTQARGAFNHENGSRELVFLSFEERMMSRDMSGRFEPIYSELVKDGGRRGPGGLTVYSFPENSGYVDEVLVVGERASDDPFVMRCLSGAAARESLAPCERDVHLGEGLALTYRMPAGLAASWREIDAAIVKKATEFLKTK